MLISTVHVIFRYYKNVWSINKLLPNTDETLFRIKIDLRFRNQKLCATKVVSHTK